MKYKIVQWFINWALKHFQQQWDLSYTRRGKYVVGGIYNDINAVRNGVNKLITNFEEAETVEDAYRDGAPEVIVDHYINIPDVCRIILPQHREIYYAHRNVDLSDIPNF